ncbi:leucine-rich repeats and immunoglobulin-like domains protein 1 [Labeo rohita]|nr:leucine-rich repeats and immunoglobulin-like domains protein 1 [Labeo rohita]
MLYPAEHISAASSSSLLVTGVVVLLSLCLLIFISLVLLWRYKKNKDQQCNINQTSDPNQSGEFQMENFPLQSDDPQSFSEITYSEVTVQKKISVDKDQQRNVNQTSDPNQSAESQTENFPLQSDIDTAETSHLVYAQIDIMDKKKTNGKEKSSESGDTFYSELKHNTDRGADAGDATCAQPVRKKNKTHQQRNVNQTSDPNQSAEFQMENFPLQSADCDHIYDAVTEVNKRHKDDPETFSEITYSEVTVQKKIPVDKDDPESYSEITYSEVTAKKYLTYLSMKVPECSEDNRRLKEIHTSRHSNAGIA